ncbi:hypothetical protein LOD99_14662 [Oopsacas minuta]|uniref:Methyltransferase type 11 domain-containing protein n=1 Tax=Oopsacas minuta TaxID=111878 RepID=A0AAV7KC13_9METZ|nr:hypothetical protein LOD99_14662 [Oopsacas minuta]
MNFLSNLSTKSLVSFIVGVGTGVTVYIIYDVVKNRRKCKEVDYYETTIQLNEYMCLHYAKEQDFDYPDLLPVNGLYFPLRCAQVCLDFCSQRGRALDVGCAVGRSSFELARGFSDVLAIDYSQRFVDAGSQLVRDGEMEYVILEEGVCGKTATALVDSDIERSRVKFMKGDACNLPYSIGTFDCILAANLICRLQNPLSFLGRVFSLLNPDGILVLTTPFTWSSKFTPQDLWLGGTYDNNVDSKSSFTELKKILEVDFELLETRDMPFLLKETRRKHQWTVSLCSVWRLKMAH